MYDNIIGKVIVASYADGTGTTNSFYQIIAEENDKVTCVPLSTEVVSKDESGVIEKPVTADAATVADNLKESLIKTFKEDFPFGNKDREYTYWSGEPMHRDMK